MQTKFDDLYLFILVKKLHNLIIMNFFKDFLYIKWFQVRIAKD